MREIANAQYDIRENSSCKIALQVNKVLNPSIGGYSIIGSP